MNPILIAKNTASSFMVSPRYVHINDDGVKKLAHVIANQNNPATFPSNPLRDDQYVLRELIANSVNYAYWYGKHDIRPNGSSSTKLYELLDKSFREVWVSDKITDSYCNAIIRDFIENLTLERFPMLSQRISHLKELMDIDGIRGSKVQYFVKEAIGTPRDTIHGMMQRLLLLFPGYANDIFLKRASLFFMMLYRTKGWFKDEIHHLPIPVDYHIPKMLKSLGCLEYDIDIAGKINEHELIPEGSLMECELRAASLIVAERMTLEAPISTVQIDDYLWLNRKACNDPFHLTITTSY